MDVTRRVTNRMLKFAEGLVSSGDLPSLKAFADIAGISRQSYYMIMNDPERNFTIEHLWRVGKRYNLDMNYFFYGIGSPILPIIL